MKTFLKDTASLFIAVAILLGIFFLPDIKQEPVINYLKVLSGSDAAEGSIEYILLQKAASGALVLLISAILIFAAHKSYKKKSDKSG